MAAWSATDDFEADSVASLNGQSGGSGWSAAWSVAAGTASVVSSPTHAGTRAVKIDSTVGTDASRALTTGVTSGVARVWFYATNVPTSTKGFYPMVLRESTTSRFYIGWGISGATGNTVSMNGSTQVTIGSGLAAATWHSADIEIDQANNRARGRVNSGAWSQYMTPNGGSFTTIDNYRFTMGDSNASDQGYYIDDISVGVAPTMTDNLASYWKFDESSGNAADSKGSNTLTNNNSTAFGTGKINNGASLVAASSNYFSIADASQSGLDGSVDMTFSFWFKPTSTVSSEQELIAKYINAGQKSYRIYADGSGNIAFQTSSDGTTASQATAVQALSAGTWYHIVVVKTGTTAKIYVNNSSLTVSGSVTSAIFNGTDALRIGTRVASGDFADGVFDELAIWTRGLSATEISNLYASGAGWQYPFANTTAQSAAAVGAGIATTVADKILGQSAAAIGAGSASTSTTPTKLIAATGAGVAVAVKTINKTLSAVGSGVATSVEIRPVQIYVNGVDYSQLIDWRSVKKTEILTAQPDSLFFMIRNVAGKTSRPALNDDVKLYINGTLMFGGVVISTRESIQGLVRFFEVTCKDYTETLDTTLVSKGYTSMTAAAIITDLLTTYAPGFTHTNVVAPFTVDAINFNYLTLSQCFQKLAEAISGYDWYVDYTKDIHFFLTGSTSAPFSLDDTSGNFLYDSLQFNADLSQVRNSVVVRGGDVEGTTVTNKQVSDGTQIVFFVGYELHTFTAQHALAATPTSFSSLTVGRDGVDDPASYDCLYNPNNGLLKFPSAYPSGDVVLTSGTPIYPLIVIVPDFVSQQTYGVKEYLIVDKNITTQQQAVDRATAELLRYSQPNYTGAFITYSDGLMQGQTLTINSTIRGIMGTFKITKIETTLRTPSGATADLAYKVSFASALSPGMVDVLNKLVIRDVSDHIAIGVNEVPARVYAALETITTMDAVVSSLSHNAQAETITATEATAQALDHGTSFVLAPYTPTGFADTKRVFIVSGSPLA